MLLGNASPTGYITFKSHGRPLFIPGPLCECLGQRYHINVRIVFFVSLEYVNLMEMFMSCLKRKHRFVHWSASAWVSYTYLILLCTLEYCPNLNFQCKITCLFIVTENDTHRYQISIILGTFEFKGPIYSSGNCDECKKLCFDYINNDASYRASYNFGRSFLGGPRHRPTS